MSLATANNVSGVSTVFDDRRVIRPSLIDSAFQLTACLVRLKVQGRRQP
jgi:hypothetical protein